MWHSSSAFILKKKTICRNLFYVLNRNFTIYLKWKIIIKKNYSSPDIHVTLGVTLPPPHLHTHTLMSCPWCIPNIHGYSKFALILNTLIDSNNFCRAIYNRELWNGSFYKTLCVVEARVLAITKLIFVHLLISDFFSNERSLFLCLRFIFFL